LLELKAATHEDGEVGNALDVIPRGKLRVLFGVDFEDDSLTGEVARDLGDVGRGRTAGAAPGRPKINEDGNFAVADDFVELVGADCDGRGGWGQRRFAGAASAGVGKVPGGNSIWLCAGGAVSNDGHGKVLY
jgi:hypothetical protein